MSARMYAAPFPSSPTRRSPAVTKLADFSITDAPTAANRRAICSPIPLDEPVTSATLFAISQPFTSALPEPDQALIDDGAITDRRREHGGPVVDDPRAGRERVARQDRRREPALDLAKACRVVVAQGAQQGAGGEAVRAQAVEDRRLEPDGCGQGPIAVQRIPVAFRR